MLNFFIAVLFLGAAISSAIQAPEKQHAKHLMDKYKELGIVGRPVTDINDVVKVKVGLNLNKILKFKKGFITFDALLKMEWKDPFLDWDPKKFGGATSIALPSDSIWTPDITIYNDYQQGADEQEDAMEKTDVLVLEDGKVIWIPRMTYKTSCHDDPKVAGQFVCSLKGGSWVHDTTKLDIDIERNDIDTQLFDPTPGIELVGHSAIVEDKEFECCPGLKYSLFTYNIVVKIATHCDSKQGSCS